MVFRCQTSTVLSEACYLCLCLETGFYGITQAGLCVCCVAQADLDGAAKFGHWLSRIWTASTSVFGDHR